MKACERMGMKIFTNELGHMTKMAAMPIMEKTFKFFFYMVCSIRYSSTTKVVHLTTLG